MPRPSIGRIVTRDYLSFLLLHIAGVPWGLLVIGLLHRVMTGRNVEVPWDLLAAAVFVTAIVARGLHRRCRRISALFEQGLTVEGRVVDSTYRTGRRLTSRYSVNVSFALNGTEHVAWIMVPWYVGQPQTGSLVTVLVDAQNPQEVIVAEVFGG
ncbi:DUF3592 domain-containing protein [Polyangium sp. y55x31]|uniref:DUF3592 domain-containing protein n=1 Tax=Polyangium sp. y55x31 TaxID=3042688 RepID=UPI002482F6DD|nr:DUF3592 domain-containing protein [Polyangium sp. y55x31]MDI1484488.1 DUF3592 domain-containing protein [Polyangium sp. y55x31]